MKIQKFSFVFEKMEMIFKAFNCFGNIVSKYFNFISHKDILDCSRISSEDYFQKITHMFQILNAIIVLFNNFQTLSSIICFPFLKNPLRPLIL